MASTPIMDNKKCFFFRQRKKVHFYFYEQRILSATIFSALTQTIFKFYDRYFLAGFLSFTQKASFFLWMKTFIFQIDPNARFAWLLCGLFYGLRKMSAFNELFSKGIY